MVASSGSIVLPLFTSTTFVLNNGLYLRVLHYFTISFKHRKASKPLLTMCQTVTESVQQQHAETTKPQPNSEITRKLQKTVEICPQDCPCRQKASGSYLPLLFNILGVLFAVFATYMMITTDSNLYLIFWICYSVLRRMMGRNKTLKMKQE